MSGKVKYNWPDFFPDSIPPDCAKPANGVVFRLVDTIPPLASDFMMTREEHPTRSYVTDQEIARSYGVSFFTKKATIQEKKRMYRPLAEKVIATGELNIKLGKISSESSHKHVTLWKCIGSQPDLFINKKVK